MTIEQFADKYHVRTRKDECGDTYIPGTPWDERYGHQIYEHGDGRFAVLLMFPADDSKSAKWSHARKKLTNAGFAIKQDGDAEGIALFDPEQKAQAKLALKLAGIHTRQLSPERRAVLAAQLVTARAKKAGETAA